MGNKWSFELETRWRQRDPSETLHFKGIVRPLVRESGQNTLDARCEAEAAKLRFTFSGTKRALASADAAKYLGNLPAHVKASLTEQEGDIDNAVQGGEVPFLVVEDFGTRGLCGDPTAHREPKGDKEKNDFYYFWRVSNKTGKVNKRGGFGLGKAVFSKASRIGAYFGLTIPKDSGQQLLMGYSQLRYHEIGNELYGPDGYYGSFESDGYPMPITETDFIENFKKDFLLSRTGESGLSIVMLYPESFTPGEVIKESIRNYYLAILNQELIIEVVDENGGMTSIQHDSLIEAINITPWKDDTEKLSILAAVELASQALCLQSLPTIRLESPQGSSAPRWRTEMFSKLDLGDMHQRYLSGEMLAFEVPFTLRSRADGPLETNFSVYLQKDLNGRAGTLRMFRQSLLVDTGRSVVSGTHSLILVDDDNLAGFIGDAENPGHDDLDEERKKFKKWMYGPTTIDFVTQSAREIVKQLLAHPGESDSGFLADVFFYEEPASTKGSSVGTPGAPTEGGTLTTTVPATPPPTSSAQTPSNEEPVTPVPKDDEPNSDGPDVPDIPLSVRKVNIVRLKDTKNGQRRIGFKVKGKADAMEPPLKVLVQAAYEVRRGDAFSRYSPWDFDLGEIPIEVKATGVQLKVQQKNTLEFETTAEQFEVEVWGFDDHAELLTRFEERT